MVFGRAKKKQDPQSPAADVVNDAGPTPKRSGQKKRKPAELLSSVVNESATGAAIDLMKRNAAFTLPNDTGWVGLLLNADEIGGLNQKQKGDATKGSIIELIAADKIQVVATKAMIDEEFLGIIPTVETLDRMGEYRLLTEAPYYWAVFRTPDNGNTLVADAVQEYRATYAQAVAVSRGESSLSDVLPHVWSWAGGETQPVLAEAAGMSDFDKILVGAAVGEASGSASAIDADPMAGAFDFAGDGVDYAELADEVDLGTGEVTDDEPVLEFDTEQFEAQFADNSLMADDEDATSFDASWESDTVDEAPAFESTDAAGEVDGYEQYLIENRDRVVDEQEVRDTIARRFLSTDLDLVVDLAEFERVFVTEAEAIALPIAEDTSDWLGSQVAQLSRQANAELSALHHSNTEDLRQTFIETMALHVEQTMTIVSTDTPGSQYAALMEGAKRDFETQRANAPQTVAQQRREIMDRFEAAAASRAEQAAAHARAVYEDKNRPKLERDLAEVGLDYDRQLEEQYAHDRQTVLELRRKDANVRMDVGTNRIFELLRERQAAHREAERALLQHWNAQLSAFIDENRKNDVARAAVLADELARSNQVEVLKAEHATELRELRAQAAEREQALHAEFARHREEALAELKARRGEWAAQLDVERQRIASGNAMAEELRAQIGTLNRQYEDRYRSRISELEADKRAVTNEMERSHVAQKRVNAVLVLLALVLTVAGVAVGVIFGWAWGHGQAVESTTAGFAALGSLLL